MENKQPNLVKAFVFVAIAVILTATGTYAFFRASIEGTESSSTISVGGATLAVEYVGTQTIKGDDVLPGWSSKKYFYVDITNETGQEISFNVNLIVDNSNFHTTTNSTDSYLQYALYKCTSSSDKTCSSSIVGLTTLTRQSGTEVVGTVKTSEKGKVYYALELKFPDTGAIQSQTGTNNQPLTFSGHVTIDASGKVYEKTPVSFADDDWGTIASVVRSKKAASASVYSVGSEKKVEIVMDDNGTKKSYKVRIANNSNYDCKDEEGNNLESETACGFVVEFVDIIEQRAMNSNSTNVGGWKATEMRKYLNGDTNEHLTYNGTNKTLFSKLPIDLRNAIIDTTVVSGHGSTSGETNFTSTDKIYLLSTGEIWRNCTTGNNCNDTASFDTSTQKTTTRQLDYYSNNKVSTSSNQTYAAKKFNGNPAWWWLRAADSYSDGLFRDVNSTGSNSNSNANSSSGGVAPAFRIG